MTAAARASSRPATACTAGSIRAASATGSVGAGPAGGSPAAVSFPPTRTTRPLARPGLAGIPFIVRIDMSSLLRQIPVDKHS